jgi:signal transduction histidine kinase
MDGRLEPPVATEPLYATLLLVDDRTDNLIVLQQVLMEYLPGCTVVTAVRAEEVVDLARQTRLDAAIIDLQMPGIDGIELCRLLKSGEHAAHVPVMLISSHSPSASVRAMGLEAGADDFVSRPIDNLELIARIKVLLRVKRAEERLRRTNRGLNELVDERTAELREAMQQQAILSGRVLRAQEDERGRISREIHDGLGQILTAIHLELERQQAAVTASRGPLDLGLALEMVRTAADETRRICQELRPLLLDQLGLEAAARHLLVEFERQPGIALHATLDLEEQARIPPEVALCTYRILQEALNNITRHAAAKVVTVSLEHRGDELRLSIADDGRGFDGSRDAVRTPGNGLVGMRERARQVEGSIDIASRPLEGTRITFRAPLRVQGTEHGDLTRPPPAR